MTLKETAYNNEVGINTKVLQREGNSGVVQGIIVRCADGCTTVAQFPQRFVFFFAKFVYFLWANRKFFIYSGWGRAGVIE